MFFAGGACVEAIDHGSAGLQGAAAMAGRRRCARALHQAAAARREARAENASNV